MQLQAFFAITRIRRTESQLYAARAEQSDVTTTIATNIFQPVFSNQQQQQKPKDNNRKQDTRTQLLKTTQSLQHGFDYAAHFFGPNFGCLS